MSDRFMDRLQRRPAYHEALPIWQCNGDAIAIRHKYNPSWSTIDYWTNWVWDWTYAVTPSAPEI